MINQRLGSVIEHRQTEVKAECSRQREPIRIIENEDGIMVIEEPLQDNCLAIIKQIKFRKWHTKITIIIKDFTLTTVALIDTGVDLNCVQEGLIPIKY